MNASRAAAAFLAWILLLAAIPVVGLAQATQQKQELPSAPGDTTSPLAANEFCKPATDTKVYRPDKPKKTTFAENKKEFFNLYGVDCRDTEGKVIAATGICIAEKKCLCTSPACQGKPPALVNSKGDVAPLGTNDRGEKPFYNDKGDLCYASGGCVPVAQQSQTTQDAINKAFETGTKSSESPATAKSGEDFNLYLKELGASGKEPGKGDLKPGESILTQAQLNPDLNKKAEIVPPEQGGGSQVQPASGERGGVTPTQSTGFEQNSTPADTKAECNWWCSTKESVSGAWDSTKQAASDTWDSTKQVASDAWDKTKDIAASLNPIGSATAKDGDRTVTASTYGWGSGSGDSPTQPLAVSTKDNPATLDQYPWTFAQKTGALGEDQKYLFTNPDTGESVVLARLDRGPYVDGRDVDISKAGAEAIGMGKTVGDVTMRPVPADTPLGPYRPTDASPIQQLGSDASSPVAGDSRQNLAFGENPPAQRLGSDASNPVTGDSRQYLAIGENPPLSNPPNQSKFAYEWQPDVSYGALGNTPAKVESGDLPDITPLENRIPVSDWKVPTGEEITRQIQEQNNRDYLAALPEPAEPTSGEEITRQIQEQNNREFLANLPPVAEQSSGEQITAQMLNQMQREDRIAQAEQDTAAYQAEQQLAKDQAALMEKNAQTEADMNSARTAAGQAELMAKNAQYEKEAEVNRTLANIQMPAYVTDPQELPSSVLRDENSKLGDLAIEYPTSGGGVSDLEYLKNRQLAESQALSEKEKRLAYDLELRNDFINNNALTVEEGANGKVAYGFANNDQVDSFNKLNASLNDSLSEYKTALGSKTASDEELRAYIDQNSTPQDQRTLDALKREQDAAQVAYDTAAKRLEQLKSDAEFKELTGGGSCVDTGFIRCPIPSATRDLEVAKARLDTVQGTYTACQYGVCPQEIEDAKAAAAKGQGPASATFKAAEESFAADARKRIENLKNGSLTSPIDVAYVLSDGIGYTATHGPRVLLEGTTVGEYLGFRAEPDKVIADAANPGRAVEEKITAGRDVALLVAPVAADLSVTSTGIKSIGSWTSGAEGVTAVVATAERTAVADGTTLGKLYAREQYNAGALRQAEAAGDVVRASELRIDQSVTQSAIQKYGGTPNTPLPAAQVAEDIVANPASAAVARTGTADVAVPTAPRALPVTIDSEASVAAKEGGSLLQPIKNYDLPAVVQVNQLPQAVVRTGTNDLVVASEQLPVAAQTKFPSQPNVPVDEPVSPTQTPVPQEVTPVKQPANDNIPGGPRGTNTDVVASKPVEPDVIYRPDGSIERIIIRKEPSLPVETPVASVPSPSIPTSWYSQLSQIGANTRQSFTDAFSSFGDSFFGSRAVSPTRIEPTFTEAPSVAPAIKNEIPAVNPVTRADSITPAPARIEPTFSSNPSQVDINPTIPTRDPLLDVSSPASTPEPTLGGLSPTQELDRIVAETAADTKVVAQQAAQDKSLLQRLSDSVKNVFGGNTSESGLVQVEPTITPVEQSPLNTSVPSSGNTFELPGGRQVSPPIEVNSYKDLTQATAAIKPGGSIEVNYGGQIGSARLPQEITSASLDTRGNLVIEYADAQALNGRVVLENPELVSLRKTELDWKAGDLTKDGVALRLDQDVTSFSNRTGVRLKYVGDSVDVAEAPTLSKVSRNVRGDLDYSVSDSNYASWNPDTNTLYIRNAVREDPANLATELQHEFGAIATARQFGSGSIGKELIPRVAENGRDLGWLTNSVDAGIDQYAEKVAAGIIQPVQVAEVAVGNPTSLEGVLNPQSTRTSVPSVSNPIINPWGPVPANTATEAATAGKGPWDIQAKTSGIPSIPLPATPESLSVGQRLSNFSQWVIGPDSTAAGRATGAVISIGGLFGSAVILQPINPEPSPSTPDAGSTGIAANPSPASTPGNAYVGPEFTDAFGFDPARQTPAGTVAPDVKKTDVPGAKAVDTPLPQPRPAAAGPNAAQLEAARQQAQQSAQQQAQQPNSFLGNTLSVLGNFASGFLGSFLKKNPQTSQPTQQQQSTTPTSQTNRPSTSVAAKPAVTLIANPSTISVGQSATLSWSSAGLASDSKCTIYGANDTSISSGGTTSDQDAPLKVKPTETTKYKITCASNGGSANGEVTVTVK